MKIGFVVNNVETEAANYTTPHLALAAHKRDHEVCLVGVGDLGYTSQGHMRAYARKPKDKRYKSTDSFMKDIRASEAVSISSKSLDVLFLRNNPADEIGNRGWAQNAAYIFGQIAVNDHVIVINHPQSLSNAINKMYFQHFPEILRPKTIITRDEDEINEFYHSNDNQMILKPLQGSGGTNVFLVDKDSVHNLPQIIEAISRDGYIIAQEYLADAKKGDIRLFLMNGEPLCVDGKYAAIKRLNKSGEVRSNISVGGRPVKVEVDQKMLELAEVLRPKIIQDGMFLVGLDVVGDKLMEINVFSPGGLNMMCKAYKLDFLTPVIAALERKLHYRNIYGGGTIDNIRLCML
jgi:glutathione synthase